MSSKSLLVSSTAWQNLRNSPNTSTEPPRSGPRERISTSMADGPSDFMNSTTLAPENGSYKTSNYNKIIDEQAFIRKFCYKRKYTKCQHKWQKRENVLMVFKCPMCTTCN